MSRSWPMSDHVAQAWDRYGYTVSLYPIKRACRRQLTVHRKAVIGCLANSDGWPGGRQDEFSWLPYWLLSTTRSCRDQSDRAPRQHRRDPRNRWPYCADFQRPRRRGLPHPAARRSTACVVGTSLCTRSMPSTTAASRSSRIASDCQPLPFGSTTTTTPSAYRSTLKPATRTAPDCTVGTATATWPRARSGYRTGHRSSGCGALPMFDAIWMRPRFCRRTARMVMKARRRPPSGGSAPFVAIARLCEGSWLRSRLTVGKDRPS